MHTALTLCVATVLAAVAEGATAAWAAWQAGASSVIVFDAWLGAAIIVLCCAWLPMLLLGVSIDRAASRRFVADARRAFGDSAALMLACVGISTATSSAVGWLLGPRVIGSVTAPFAGLVLGLGATLCFVVVLAALGVAASALGARFAVLRDDARCLWMMWLALAMLLWLSLRHLPFAYLVAPLTWLVALSLQLAPSIRSRLAGVTRVLTSPGMSAVTIIGLSVLTLLLVSDRLLYAAQSASIRSAPWAGQVLSVAWTLTDQDGDGFSAYWGGGDCDDLNKHFHPAARDVPGDGRDENCNGRDAPIYALPTPPTARPDKTLPTRPNFLLIQLDALRPDHLHFAGYARATSPNLDRFKQRAIWFRNAYTTAPSTRYAMTSVFTGYDARRTPHHDERGNRFRLDERAITVAEQLARAGYDNLGFTISYVIHHNRGLGQGYRSWNTPWPVNEWERTDPIAAELTTAAVLEHLDKTPGDEARPFLTFAHYRCNHDPYFKYDAWNYGNRDIDRYDSALNYCDVEIGKVLDAVAARADAKRTVVIIFSDHGELFGEHGATNHGNTLYEPDVRVVLLAAIPGLDASVITTPVSLSDIAPTMLELAGLRVARDLDGWSLLAQLATPAPAARPLFMFTDLWRGPTHYQSSAVLRWPYKYIRDIATGREELYDVTNDNQERSNLALSQPSVHRELSDLADAYDSFVKRSTPKLR